MLLLTAVLYGPLRQRLSARVRRLVLGGRDAPYDVVAGLASTLERADEGAEQLAAVARRGGAAFGIGFVRLEVDRANGERLTATHGAGPAEVRTLPITYREQEVGRRGAAGARLAQPADAGATSSCWATWSARRPARPAPASWPRSSRTAASGSSSPARRSGAGSGATCTTGSGRP